MRVFSYLAGAFALLVATADAGAQFPGEIRGDVVDVLSGRPVPTAEVRVVGTSATAVADAAGAFRLRGLEPGSHILEVRAPGYVTERRDVAVSNGAVAVVRLELVPDAVELEGLVARVDLAPEGARTLSGPALRAIPATTVGELTASIPGVSIESRGRGGSQVPSIRGSGGDAVLVLVDGVPINDPVTGEADLSTVPAASVSAVHVLPGGRSARYGARAEGGVILVETGGSEAGGSLGAFMGSLGAWNADGVWSFGGSESRLEVGAGLRRMDGGFEFDLPAEVGGGTATRRNAYAHTSHGRVMWAGERGSTGYRLGASAETLERGLPGRSFAPSVSGAQELERARLSGSLDWEAGSVWRLSLDGHGVVQRMDHRDPDPPFGDPFDDRTTLGGGGAEAGVSWRSAGGVRLGVGVDVRHLSVRSSQLAEDMRTVRRTDAGVRVTGSGDGPWDTRLSITLRADRSGLPVETYVSHDIGLSWAGAGGFDARVGHRSSFSPPTLGDQFFREGVGVQPNPELRAERVPSEWTAALGWERRLGQIPVSVDVEAYRGDIHGMIVWLPDFRFVWSPLNRDVRRHGAEVVAAVGGGEADWQARSHLSWNRVTYRRPGLENTQVVYRPELSGGVVLSWRAQGWRASVATDLVGARYPVPNRVNRLPAFWTTDFSLARSWSTPFGDLEIGVEVERVFDHEDSLIFGYPDPGRTARLTARIDF